MLRLLHQVFVNQYKIFRETNSWNSNNLVSNERRLDQHTLLTISYKRTAWSFGTRGELNHIRIFISTSQTSSFGTKADSIDGRWIIETRRKRCHKKIKTETATYVSLRVIRVSTSSLTGSKSKSVTVPFSNPAPIKCLKSRTLIIQLENIRHDDLTFHSSKREQQQQRWQIQKVLG